MRLISRKMVITAFLLCLGYFLVWYVSLYHFSYRVSEFCEDNLSMFRSCGEVLSSFVSICLLGSILFAPAFLSLPFKLVAFENWKRFAVWAVPFVVGVTWLLFSIDIGGDIRGLVVSSMIITALFALYALYFIVSLTIISVTWYKNRG